MAVIIREEKYIEGKKYIIKTYKSNSGKLLTKKDKIKAEKLDLFLLKKLNEIEAEMVKLSILKLKGKKGKVHKLWYEIGKRLDFITDTGLIPADDREYVWRAIYDHACNLAPGPISERAIRSPETSHFSYCFKLSRFPWKFVQSVGDWTSWSEFFDRKETRNDSRIIQWLGETAIKNNISGRQNWLRPLTKAIHKEFSKKDTTVFSINELYKILDTILDVVKANDKS